MDKVYHSPGSFFKPLTPDEHQEFMYYVKLRRLEMLANYGDWLGRELQKIRAQLKSAATESGRTGRWEAHLGIGRMSVHVFRFQEEEVNPGRAGDNTEPNTKAWLDEYRRVAFTESASVVEFAKLEILRAQMWVLVFGSVCSTRSLLMRSCLSVDLFSLSRWVTPNPNKFFVALFGFQPKAKDFHMQ